MNDVRMVYGKTPNPLAPDDRYTRCLSKMKCNFNSLSRSNQMHVKLIVVKRWATGVLALLLYS
jgi:hypothetical protein